MAQLKDLLVVGSSHFIGDVYFNKIPKYNNTELALNREINIANVGGLNVSNGTINLNDLSNPLGVSIGHGDKPNSGNAQTTTAGSGRTYITQIDVDTYGHIAKVYTASETDQNLSNYKTKQTAVSTPGAKGNATAFIDSITQNANGEIAVTKKNITAADLGLTGAMSFIGIYATEPTTAFPGTNNARELRSGDVYVNSGNYKEYVYNGSNWEELGDEGSYALKTITITGNEGLEGGGDLTENRTIGIKDEGVTTDKIADDAVTTAKIADDAVTSEKIADGTIVIGNIDSGVYSSAGNRAATLLVSAAAEGQINSEKYAVTQGTTVKATMQYDDGAKAVKFVFAQ